MALRVRGMLLQAIGAGGGGVGTGRRGAAPPRKSSFVRPVADPNLIRGDAALDWPDGAVAGYLKAVFKVKVIRMAKRHEIARDLHEALTKLDAKNCEIGPKTVGLAVNYLARLKHTKAAFGVFEKYKMRSTTKVTATVYDQLLFAACKANDLSLMEQAFAMADANYVEMSIRGWNAALRCAARLNGGQPNEDALRSILARMRDRNVEMDLISHHILIPTFTVAQAEDAFANLTKLGGAFKPNQHTYHAMIQCAAGNADRAKLVEWVQRAMQAGHPTKTPSIANACMLLFQKTRDYDGAYALFEDLLENPVHAPTPDLTHDGLGALPQEERDRAAAATEALGGEYRLTHPLMAMFVRTMSTGSAKACDRCDRMVTMAFHVGKREGLLYDQKVLLGFLAHFAKVRNPTLSQQVLNLMREDNITITDLHIKYSKEAAMPYDASDAAAPVPHGAAEHTQQLVTALRKGRVSEVVPLCARVAKRTASAGQRFLLQDVILAGVAAVLKENIGIPARSLSPTGVALFIMTTAVNSAAVLKTGVDTLAPATLLRPFIPPGASTALATAEQTLVALVRRQHTDTVRVYEPLLKVIVEKQGGVELAYIKQPLPARLERQLVDPVDLPAHETSGYAWA